MIFLQAIVIFFLEYSLTLCQKKKSNFATSGKLTLLMKMKYLVDAVEFRIDTINLETFRSLLSVTRSSKSELPQGTNELLNV